MALPAPSIDVRNRYNLRGLALDGLKTEDPRAERRRLMGMTQDRLSAPETSVGGLSLLALRAEGGVKKKRPPRRRCF